MAIDADVAISPAAIGERRILTLQWSLTDTSRHGGPHGSKEAIAHVADWLVREIEAYRESQGQVQEL